MRVGRFRLERLRLSGITGRPVWNRPLPDGRELWQVAGASWVEEQRRAGATEDEIARGLAAALVPVLVRLHEELRLSGCFLTGGLCAIDGFREAVSGVPLAMPVSVARDPVWAAAEAGLAWLEAQGAAGAVVDVGQTSIKTLTASGRSLRTRDLEALPLRLIAPDGTSRGAPTAPAASFLAQGLGAASHGSGPASHALLALPCPLDDDLVPGPCTYGWEGDRDLLPAAFRELDDAWPVGEVSVAVLNDAELAAETARRSLAPGPGSRVLSLTLGFGPGGALLEA